MLYMRLSSCLDCSTTYSRIAHLLRPLMLSIPGRRDDCCLYGSIRNSGIAASTEKWGHRTLEAPAQISWRPGFHEPLLSFTRFRL